MSKLIYLASPYSKFPAGREQAEREVGAAAAFFMELGYKIFAPIPHSHAIEQHMDHIHDGDFWLEQDFAVLDRCDELWVYKMPSWDESYGVKKEIERAKERGIPITYVDYEVFT